MLESEIVTEGFCVAGGDIRICAQVLYRVALEDELFTDSMRQFDNDRGQLA
jgi:hypothetical protein